MAVERTRATRTVVKTERTRAVEIDCDVTQPEAQWRVTWHRQEAFTDDTGAVISPPQSNARVDRTFAQIAGDTVTLSNGRNISARMIAEAISLFGDKYRAEDEAAEVAA